MTNLQLSSFLFPHAKENNLHFIGAPTQHLIFNA
jgi:hypothetical protein